MLKSLSAAALAASMVIAATPATLSVAFAQAAAAPEPPHGVTPNDTPAASSGSADKDAASSSKMKTGTMKKSSMKKTSKKKSSKKKAM